jgi:CMP-N-acetylneuraminic acid synthetase
MRTVAIIPARGGSKGIPRKNVLPVGGRPLIRHTLDAALAARRVDAVYVSTDDAEIAAVAREAGARIIDRPAALSGDTASSESALLHALEVLRETEGLPDVLVFIQCTSPLTRTEDIDGALETLEARGADSVFTGSPFFHFLWREEADGGWGGVNHDKRVRLRRQERSGEYLETGAVYVMRVPGFLASRHRFFGKTVVHPVPPERSFEIDDLLDVRVIEAIMQPEGSTR